MSTQSQPDDPARTGTAPRWFTPQWFRQLLGATDTDTRGSCQPALRIQITLEHGVASVSGSQLKAIPLFADCDAAFLQQLAGKFVSESYPAGSRVVRQGEEADKFYILADGEAVVSEIRQGAHIELAVLGAGDFLGEIALLNDGKRMADVDARTDCTLLSLGYRDFFGALGALPRFRESLEAMAGQREYANQQTQLTRLLQIL